MPKFFSLRVSWHWWCNAAVRAQRDILCHIERVRVLLGLVDGRCYRFLHLHMRRVLAGHARLLPAAKRRLLGRAAVGGLPRGHDLVHQQRAGGAYGQHWERCDGWVCQRRVSVKRIC